LIFKRCWAIKVKGDQSLPTHYSSDLAYSAPLCTTDYEARLFGPSMQHRSLHLHQSLSFTSAFALNAIAANRNQMSGHLEDPQP
jgi:hypothetical protein